MNAFEMHPGVYKISVPIATEDLCSDEQIPYHSKLYLLASKK